MHAQSLCALVALVALVGHGELGLLAFETCFKLLERIVHLETSEMENFDRRKPG